MIACRSPEQDPDGSQPRSIRRQAPTGRTAAGHPQHTHTTAQATSPDGLLPRKTEHTHRCAASARSHDGRVSTLCPATATHNEAVELRRFYGNGPITSAHLLSTHGLSRRHRWDDSASRLSAHAAPLVSPQSSSTHGKLCDDPSPEDWILFRMFQRHERGSRLNSSFFFFGGVLPCHPKLSQRLRRCFGSRSSGIEIALVRGRRDVDWNSPCRQCSPWWLLAGCFALGPATWSVAPQ
jgi:hypothetical protein